MLWYLYIVLIGDMLWYLYIVLIGDMLWYLYIVLRGDMLWYLYIVLIGDMFWFPCHTTGLVIHFHVFFLFVYTILFLYKFWS